MNSCGRDLQIEAYHDGALDGNERAAVEEHLHRCADCRRALESLRLMSNWFKESAREGLSPAARGRVYRNLEAVMDRGLLRLEWAMSGLAAAVLLAGALWLSASSEAPASAAPPPWVGVATAGETAQAPREPVTPVAEWYLADASGKSDETP